MMSNIARQAKRLATAALRAQLDGLGDWVGAACLFMMLGVVVWCVEQAQWITPQPSLLATLALGLATGFLLARSHVPAVVAHVVAVVLGAGTVLWQGTNLLPPAEVATRFGRLIGELQSWWQDARSGVPSEGTIQVGLLLICLTWLISYVSIWLLVRRRNPWVAVFVGAAGILINLNYLTEKDYRFFFFYLVAALFLIAQAASVAHYSWFRKHVMSYPRGAIRYFIVLVLGLTALIVSVAWQTPEFHAHGVETVARTETSWRQAIETQWHNFFAAVPASRPILVHGGKGALRFSDSFELGEQALFFVKADRPRYWRTQTYDIYTSEGWITSAGTDHMLGQGVTRSNVASSPYDDLTYIVVPQVYTDVVLTTGEFASSNIPVVMTSLTPLTFNIGLFDSSGDSALPADVASARYGAGRHHS